MKRITTIFMLFMAVAMITSCGKNKETEKERVLKQLTSGKWFYEKVKNIKTGYESDCFNSSNYWEFDSSGNVEEHWDFGDGTYTISEDGKTIVVKFNYGDTFTISNITITESTFSFNLNNDGHSFKFTLSKTAGDCFVP